MQTHFKSLNKFFSVKYCSKNRHEFKFVPKHSPFCLKNLDQLQEFVDANKSLLVITGAGISTESGIPDYRSEGVGLYATSDKRPVQFKDFLQNFKVRQRYWARNYVGWQRFYSFKPNINHLTISEWEKKKKIKGIITQNVDGLHHKAKSKSVIELHGTAYEVICLDCSFCISRNEFQKELFTHNNYLSSMKSGAIRPDGDIELSEEEMQDFTVPDCPDCRGILKPNIVFFGDSVPKSRVERAKEEVASSDALLVLGSSLYVYSAYRFVLQAAELRIPVAIINIGETRGDKFAKFRVSARCGEILPLVNV